MEKKMRNWLRISFAQKMLLWCGVLVTLSFFAISLLFNTMSTLVGISESIVNSSHASVAQADRLLPKLLTVLEHKKRYEILRHDSMRLAYDEELASVLYQLHGFVVEHPAGREAWARLEASIFAAVERARIDSVGLLADQDLDLWIQQVKMLKDSGKQEIESRIMQLYEISSEARNIAQDRLLLAGGIGIAGSLLITWVLHSSLRRLLRAIRHVSGKERFVPIPVMTSDELGEVAVAFNEMASQLEREETMRADFISMLSHEIRTPLTSIQESVNLLREGILGPLGEKQMGLLDVASREAHRLARLLDQLMRVSSLEANTLALELGQVNCSELMQDCKERIEPVSMSKGVSVLIDTNVQGIAVLADGSHIQQVLLNLLNNAVKFSPKGSAVSLHCRLQPCSGRVQDCCPEDMLQKSAPAIAKSSRKEWVVFCVLDNGPGIDAEDLPHVFGKYYRSEKTRNRASGLGLGLHISKRIVEAHGGEIWVDSKADLGTVFCFSLPLYRTSKGGATT